MTNTPKLEWHALYADEGEPWVAYVEGHHDLSALALTAEAAIRQAFPDGNIGEYLDSTGGAVLSHFWLVCAGDNGHFQCFELAKAGDQGAFPVTGVRFC